LRYLVLYFLAGIGAGLFHAYLHPDSVVPTVGASGAISGVLGSFFVLFPRARVFTLVPLIFLLFPIVQVPAALYLGFWFLMQLMSGALALVFAGDAGGVAWWAHVGGFVAGMALVPVLRRRWSYPRVWRDQYAPW
jgi:membrane associated rhomboid family serine protease